MILGQQGSAGATALPQQAPVLVPPSETAEKEYKAGEVIRSLIDSAVAPVPPARDSAGTRTPKDIERLLPRANSGAQWIALPPPTTGSLPAPQLASDRNNRNTAQQGRGREAAAAPAGPEATSWEATGRRLLADRLAGLEDLHQLASLRTKFQPDGCWGAVLRT